MMKTGFKKPCVLHILCRLCRPRLFAGGRRKHTVHVSSCSSYAKMCADERATEGNDVHTQQGRAGLGEWEGLFEYQVPRVWKVV